MVRGIDAIMRVNDVLYKCDLMKLSSPNVDEYRAESVLLLMRITLNNVALIESYDTRVDIVSNLLAEVYAEYFGSAAVNIGTNEFRFAAKKILEML